MEPLRPMKPMRPPAPADRWWSEELGDPSSSGAQDGSRYAFFEDKRLLLIERGGKLQRFRTGVHRIIGISQVSRREELTFTSEQGPVNLEDFEKMA
jgi:hypothetical protein